MKRALVVVAMVLSPALAAAEDFCWESRWCTYDPCPVRLPRTPVRVCRNTNLPWGQEYWVSNELGNGCNTFSGPPGRIGSDWCVASAGYIERDGASGICEVISIARMEGPSCCIVGCPPQAPGCHPF